MDAAIAASWRRRPVHILHVFDHSIPLHSGYAFRSRAILNYPRVSSRLTETVTPLKPLEPMAQRRHATASDVGGHRELIRDGDTGVLFRADSPDEQAAAALALIARPDRREAMRDAGRRCVKQEGALGGQSCPLSTGLFAVAAGALMTIHRRPDQPATAGLSAGCAQGRDAGATSSCAS